MIHRPVQLGLHKPLDPRMLPLSILVAEYPPKTSHSY